MLFRKFFKHFKTLLKKPTPPLKKTQTKNKVTPTEFIVACSGGVDSMVLLDLTRRYCEHKAFLKTHPKKQASSSTKAGYRVRALYVDHGQRSAKEITQDQEMIQRYCDKYSIPFEKLALDLPAFASEDLMRKARYKAFAKAAKPNEILLTAHHAQDQLETYLFRLLRGAHPETLRGIPAKAKRKNAKILRPLLPFWKEELISYAKQYQIPWRDDSTNQDVAYARNEIRTILLPLLERLRPGSRKRVLQFFEDLHNMSKLSRPKQKISWLIAALQNPEGAKTSDVEFLELKLSVDKLLAAESHRTTRSHWENTKRQLGLRKQMRGGPKKRLEFPGGNALLFERDRLFWVKKSV